MKDQLNISVQINEPKCSGKRHFVVQKDQPDPENEILGKHDNITLKIVPKKNWLEAKVSCYQLCCMTYHSLISRNILFYLLMLLHDTQDPDKAHDLFFSICRTCHWRCYVCQTGSESAEKNMMWTILKKIRNM